MQMVGTVAGMRGWRRVGEFEMVRFELVGSAGVVGEGERDRLWLHRLGFRRRG